VSRVHEHIEGYLNGDFLVVREDLKLNVIDDFEIGPFKKLTSCSPVKNDSKFCIFAAKKIAFISNKDY